MKPSIEYAWTRRSILVASVAFAAIRLAFAPLGASAQSGPIEVGVGDTATIELDGNPSTGFRWVLDDGASESAGLVRVEDLGYVKRELAAGERPVLGAPSKYQFLVTGLEAGSVKLVFTYVRGNDTAPAKTQEVPIEVVGD